MNLYVLFFKDLNLPSAACSQQIVPRLREMQLCNLSNRK